MSYDICLKTFCPNVLCLKTFVMRFYLITFALMTYVLLTFGVMTFVHKHLWWLHFFHGVSSKGTREFNFSKLS